MHLFIALFNESGYVEASSPNKSVEVTARVVASRFPDRQQSRAGADDDDNERLHRWQSSETERSISDDDRYQDGNCRSSPSLCPPALDN